MLQKIREKLYGLLGIKQTPESYLDVDNLTDEQLTVLLASGCQLSYAATGYRVYPPLVSGYPPKQDIYLQATGNVANTEIPAGGANIGAAGQFWKGAIIVPSTAVLTIGGVALPAAPAQGWVIPIETYGAQAASSAVTPSHYVGTRKNISLYATVSR